MYLIIVGAGKVGIRALEFALEDNVDTIVIDKNKNKIDKANKKYDCVFIHGDATFKSTLKEAGANKADALISTTGSDAESLLIMKNGKELGISRLTSIVNHFSRVEHFEELNVDIVGDPNRTIGQYLYRSIRGIPAKDYMAKGISLNNYMKLSKGAEVFDIKIEEDSPIIGEKLRDIFEQKLNRDETIIIGIDRKGELIIPRADTEFQKQDLITIFSKKGPTSEILEIFAGKK